MKQRDKLGQIVFCFRTKTDEFITSLSLICKHRQKWFLSEKEKVEKTRKKSQRRRFLKKAEPHHISCIMHVFLSKRTQTNTSWNTECLITNVWVLMHAHQRTTQMVAVSWCRNDGQHLFFFLFLQGYNFTLWFKLVLLVPILWTSFFYSHKASQKHSSQNSLWKPINTTAAYILCQNLCCV